MHGNWLTCGKVGFWGPIWAQQGGLEGSRGRLVGARGCILSFLGIKSHPGPDEKALGMNRKLICVVLSPFLCENEYLRKTYFFDSSLAHFECE